MYDNHYWRSKNLAKWKKITILLLQHEKKSHKELVKQSNSSSEMNL